jgi:predicted alpha/beta-fold hydrolase
VRTQSGVTVIVKKYKFIIAIIVFFIFAVLLFNAGINMIISKLAFYPDKKNKAAVRESFIDEVYIAINKNTTIHGYYLNHFSGADKTVLYFHGNAGNAFHRLGDAMILYDEGFNVLLVDYRGMGKAEEVFPKKVSMRTRKLFIVG